MSTIEWADVSGLLKLIGIFLGSYLVAVVIVIALILLVDWMMESSLQRRQHQWEEWLGPGWWQQMAAEELTGGCDEMDCGVDSGVAV